MCSTGVARHRQVGVGLMKAR